MVLLDLIDKMRVHGLDSAQGISHARVQAAYDLVKCCRYDGVELVFVDFVPNHLTLSFALLLKTSKHLGFLLLCHLVHLLVIVNDNVAARLATGALALLTASAITLLLLPVLRPKPTIFRLLEHGGHIHGFALRICGYFSRRGHLLVIGCTTTVRLDDDTRILLVVGVVLHVILRLGPANSAALCRARSLVRNALARLLTQRRRASVHRQPSVKI